MHEAIGRTEQERTSALVEPASPAMTRHASGASTDVDLRVTAAKAANARLPGPLADAPSPGRIQRSAVIRRELDPNLRDALIHQRGAARGIDARSATRDVDRSAGLRPVQPAPDPGAEAATQEAARQRDAERAAREARFNDPTNVATRAERAQADEQREAAALAAAQAQMQEKQDWEQIVTKQFADRQAILDRRETLVLSGLDDALILRFPELRAADAEVLRATSALDIDAATNAIDTAEKCFSQVAALVEKVDDLAGRFAVVRKEGIGTKHQRNAEKVRVGLAKRTELPWAEFAETLPEVETLVVALEKTLTRREQQAGDRAERQLEQRAVTEFAAAPNKDTLKAQLDAGLIGRGEVMRTYRSNDDRLKGEFSVEVAVRRLNTIVIHAHCRPDGTPKSGNAAHWKYFTERKVRGKTHPLTTQLVAELIDTAAAKKHRDANRSLRDT